MSVGVLAAPPHGTENSGLERSGELPNGTRGLTSELGFKLEASGWGQEPAEENGSSRRWGRAEGARLTVETRGPGLSRVILMISGHLPNGGLCAPVATGAFGRGRVKQRQLVSGTCSPTDSGVCTNVFKCLIAVVEMSGNGKLKVLRPAVRARVSST